MKTYCEQCDEEIESIEQVMNRGTDQELTIHICPKCEEPIEDNDDMYDDDEDLDDWLEDDDDFEGDDEALNEDDLDL